MGEKGNVEEKNNINGSRMKLDAVTKGRYAKPQTIMILGVEKVGKTTFAADAEAPIFIDAEEGSFNLDAARFPKPLTWGDVRSAVSELATSEHGYRTLVIDTLDAIEPMLWDYICKRDDQDNIEAYGYGKGYVVAFDEWRLLLADLERLREKKNMNVILISHVHIRPFKNPIGDDYDRYESKLHNKAAGLIKSWCDIVLFANYKTYTATDKRTKRVKGVGGDVRVIYTNRQAAYDAGNRYNLPAELPLSWAEFEAAMKAGSPAAEADLRKSIEQMAADLGDEKILSWINSQLKNVDSRKLVKIHNRLATRIAETTEETK